MGKDDLPHDLSEYELRRLENIKRNEAFLLQMGISAVKPLNNQAKKSEDAEAAELKKRKRKEVVPKEILQGTRKSPRLRGAKVESPQEEEEEESESDDGIDYDRMPQDPEQLDDVEFQIYVELKKWRLLRCRELEIEPYAVFQNRTLCEFIRRKRNDANWALPIESPNPEEDEITRLKKELLECWGIGPTKAKPDRFGFEINDVFHKVDSTLLSSLRQTSEES